MEIALLIMIVILCVVNVGCVILFSNKNEIDDMQRKEERNSVYIAGLIMELECKLKICDNRLVMIQQMLNSKEAEEKSTKQEVGKMSYRVKPNKYERTIDFVFEHDGEEYSFKVVERDARQAILDKFVKPESREAVDKFLKENDLWAETLDKLAPFLNEYYEEEFQREVRKW